MKNSKQDRRSSSRWSRRRFLSVTGSSLAVTAATSKLHAQDNEIQGFDETAPGVLQERRWRSVSDRKINVGIVGYGVCKFGAKFGFQNHPNIQVTAVSDLFPDRCAALAKECRCEKTYSSLQEMVKDDSIEAIFLATDAPSHAKHAMLCLSHGKHVACAVPAVWASVEEGDQLFEAVRKSNRKYMLFETSAYRPDCYAMRQAYQAGVLGKIIYSEGQYYHYFNKPLGSYRDWRNGLPPMWYPTHSTAYYIAVTGGSFTHVSCQGFRGSLAQYQVDANPYGNPFDSEMALFRTSEGGAARMSVCWGTRGSHGEYGHVRGEKAQMEGTTLSPALDAAKVSLELAKPPLPPGMPAGGHGGSHGYLTDEFVHSILQNRDPLINVAWALNMTVPGIIAHQSALKNGELLEIPQYEWPV